MQRHSAIARWRRPGAALAVCMALLLWPALVNTQPLYYEDTTDYLRAAALYADLLGGATPEGTGEPVLAGRSPVYGAVLQVSHALGSFWPVAIAQVALCVMALWLVLRRLVPESGLSHLLILVAGLGLFSTLPFYSVYLMPDLFAALTILGTAHLLVQAERIGPRELVFWGVVLSVAMLVHMTHMAIAAGLIGAALLWRLVRTRPLCLMPGAALVGGALLIGITGEIVQSRLAEGAPAAAPVRLPYLQARLISDGPGARTLKRHCDGEARFALCAYAGRLPMSFDEVMWSKDPQRGAFAIAPPEVQRRMASEQVAFALVTLREEPAATILSMVRNAVRQLTIFGIGEINHTGATRARVRAGLDGAAEARFLETPSARGAFPKTLFNGFIALGGLAAVGVLMVHGVSAVRQRAAFGGPGDRGGRVRPFVLLVLLGICLNAALCGALSEPIGRFQARVVWLLPAIALMADMALRPEHWRVWLRPLTLRLDSPGER